MELKGKITIDGRESEFMLLDEGSWSQWGADTSTLGGRTDLLDALAEAYQVWRQENLCTECGDHLLDDGEGFDGKCGNCADRAEKDGEYDDEPEASTCKVCHERITWDGKEWVHFDGDMYCGTGDGAMALPDDG